MPCVERRRDGVEARFAHDAFDRRAIVEQSAPVAERDVLVQARLVRRPGSRETRLRRGGARRRGRGCEAARRRRGSFRRWDRRDEPTASRAWSCRTRCGRPARPPIPASIESERSSSAGRSGARVGEADTVELDARRADRRRLRRSPGRSPPRSAPLTIAGPTIEEIGEVGEEERALARGADLRGEVARGGAQPHARQGEGGEAGEVDHAGAGARGHPGHGAGEPDQIDARSRRCARWPAARRAPRARRGCRRDARGSGRRGAARGRGSASPGPTRGASTWPR